MFGAMEMLRRMLILGRITAANVPAFQAKAQMDPGIAGLDAIFADVGIGGLKFDLLHVTTALGHGFLL
jgi:proline racemase